ncbi:MAG: hypothetical protein Kow0075_11400 [Salibacteraceae bacterium]
MFLFIAMLFISCSSNNIDCLKHQKVKFTDLPHEVAEYLRNPTDYQDDIQNRILEIPKGIDKEYRLETVNTLVGPWVSHHKIISTKTGKFYEIDQGVPSPYIVYKNKLYIPDEYNIFTTVDDLDSIEFTRYDLE